MYSQPIKCLRLIPLQIHKNNIYIYIYIYYIQAIWNTPVMHENPFNTLEILKD